MCASGPGPLHPRGAGRCAALRGRGPPWRRCPWCWTELSVVLNWSCPWCWSGAQPCRTGRELSTLLQPPAARWRRLLILIPSARLGQSSPGEPWIRFPVEEPAAARLACGLRCPPRPPSLPTLSSSCRCGFSVFLFFFQGAPSSSGAQQVPSRPSKGCPRGGVAREPSWRGQSCLWAAQLGGGLCWGLSLSHAARLSHLTVPPPLLLRLPGTGWDRFSVFRQLVS